MKIKNKNFIELHDIQLEKIDGGGNTWQQNVSGLWGSATAGCALGSIFGGPIGCFVGAHYGPVGWVTITGLTGGFGK